MSGPTLDLTGATKYVIDDALARHVMGWTEHDSSFEECQWSDSTGERHGAPDSMDADTIVRLLEKEVGGEWESSYADAFDSRRWWAYEVHINGVNGKFIGRGDTFCRAGVVALLRAAGVEVKGDLQ